MDNIIKDPEMKLANAEDAISSVEVYSKKEKWRRITTKKKEGEERREEERITK